MSGSETDSTEGEDEAMGGLEIAEVDTEEEYEISQSISPKFSSRVARHAKNETPTVDSARKSLYDKLERAEMKMENYLNGNDSDASQSTSVRSTEQLDAKKEDLQSPNPRKTRSAAKKDAPSSPKTPKDKITRAKIPTTPKTSAIKKTTTKKASVIITVEDHSVDLATLPPTTSLYRLANAWMRDIGENTPEMETEAEIYVSEIRLPQPGKHTEQTLAKCPPRRKVSQLEIDTILKANPAVTTDELMQTHLARARAVKQWFQIQYIHRLNRYKLRLRKILTENNTNNMTATDELMTKYIAKLGPLNE